MKSIKSVIAVLVVIIAGVLAGCGSKPSIQLVPAWKLFPEQAYRGILVKDPFVSWSPDSKSLLVSGTTFNSQEQFIMRWRVGDRKLDKIGEGLTPSFINADEFIFFRDEPKGIFIQNLKTGERKETMTTVRNDSFWSETKGISYDSKSRSVALRLTEFTPRYLRGTELYDLNGKPLGAVANNAGPDVLEYSSDPRGSQCALLVQEDASHPVLLEIAKKSNDRGKQIASGSLMGVAWSPTRDMVAYGDGKQVILARPDDGKQVVVGRFGKGDDPQDANYVSRLSWSPDGKYLAVLYYVASDSGDYPLLYVLDMTRFQWDH